MSFKDIRFPPEISFHAIGGPGFQTNIVSTNSGQEFRDSVWSLERGEWEVSHAVRLPEQYKPLQAFFRTVKGRAYSFRFKDWSDFTIEPGEIVFTELDSSGTTLQIWKRYTFGEGTSAEIFDRKITKLVATPNISGGTVASVNLITGVVTMTTGTPTDITVPCEFDCHARFDTDKMKAETIDRSGRDLIIGWSSIPIIEIKS